MMIGISHSLSHKRRENNWLSSLSFNNNNQIISIRESFLSFQKTSKNKELRNEFFLAIILNSNDFHQFIHTFIQSVSHYSHKDFNLIMVVFLFCWYPFFKILERKRFFSLFQLATENLHKQELEARKKNRFSKFSQNFLSRVCLFFSSLIIIMMTFFFFELREAKPIC